MDSTFLSTAFTGVSNLGSTAMNLLFIKQVWFERAQILKVLLVTRVAFSGCQRKIYGNILRIVMKVAPVLFLGMIFYSNYFSDDGYFNDNTVLRYAWKLLKAHAITANISVRLHVLSMMVSLLLLYLNVHQELDLSQGNMQRGLKMFRLLRWKMDVINDFFGNQLLAWYIVVVAFYCKVPDMVMSPSFSDTLGIIFIYMANDSIGWIIAAEYYHLVQQTFLRWLWSANYNNSPFLTEHWQRRAIVLEFVEPTKENLDLGTMKAEFQFEYLALSTRFFRVTYGFLGAVSILVLHYICIHIKDAEWMS